MTAENNREEFNRGRNAARRRWGTITRKEIDQYVHRLRDAAYALEALGPVIDTFGIVGEIRIDGATKWQRGIEGIESFVENVKEGIVREQYEARRR